MPLRILTHIDTHICTLCCIPRSTQQIVLVCTLTPVLIKICHLHIK